MKRFVISAAAMTAFASVPAVAQGVSSSCPGGSPTSAAQVSQDACQQTIDLFKYMAPQLGTAIAGGNATLGMGGTLGGLGHFSVGLRANAVAGSVPEVDQVTPGITGAQRRTYQTSTIPVPMATADLAIGVWQGLPLGLTNVGGIDVLVSGTYIPAYDDDNVSVDPDTPFKFGYGVRIGALQVSILVPGVSVTYLKRDLPRMSLSAQVTTDSLIVRALDVQTSAWRVVVSKSLIMFGVAAGIGQDTYKSGATAQGIVNRSILGVAGRFPSPVIAQDQDITRTNMFADISFNLPFVKIVGEIGQASGGAVETFNSFADKAAAASRLYGSLGIRIGW